MGIGCSEANARSMKQTFSLESKMPSSLMNINNISRMISDVISSFFSETNHDPNCSSISPDLCLKMPHYFWMGIINQKFVFQHTSIEPSTHISCVLVCH